MRAACEVGLLVMREVSLVGVSQAEAGYNSNSNTVCVGTYASTPARTNSNQHPYNLHAFLHNHVSYILTQRAASCTSTAARALGVR